MPSSGSIEIPFAAEWSQLRRDREALCERLERLEAERGKVSDTVYERVRADYQQRQSDLDARFRDLASRAEREASALRETTARQEETAHRLRAELEEYDLRERLGELLDAGSARRASGLRQELRAIEDDLISLVELRDNVAAIASGERRAPIPPTDPARPALAAVDLPPVPDAAAAGPGAGTARLVPIESADGSDFFALTGRTIVGRSGESELRLPIGTVSRRHAELDTTAEGWTVRDLHSENGTWVNDERIWERVLVEGDRVQFGSVCFVFHLS